VEKSIQKQGQTKNFVTIVQRVLIKSMIKQEEEKEAQSPGGAYNQKGVNNNNFKYGCQYKDAIEKVYCSLCGSMDNLLIHHIDHDRKNNDISNLIVLCKKCHQEHHTKRDPKTGKYLKQN
jgi:hypothetical protein